MREEARQAGVDSPTVFVFLPRLEADELRQTIGQHRAAEETVNTRAVPQTTAGIEAKGAMQSRIALEKKRVSDLADNIIKSARVYQGGGNEIIAESFSELVRQAVEASLIRLFPKFPDADQPAWNRVLTRAAQGAVDPLSAIGYTSDVEKHPVCQEVRSFVGGAGKKGSDVRRKFADPPYGWSRDAVDGALLALLAGGVLRAMHGGQAVIAKGMTQQQIPVAEFFIEGVIVTALQRIGVRKVASALGLAVTSGEEAAAVPVILDRLQSEAQNAGGEAPLPQRPDADIVNKLREMAGNSQIVEVAEQADILIAHYKEWALAGEAARERLPEWKRLEELLHHARNLPVTAELNPQVEAIRNSRTLLADPNPTTPLLSKVTSDLRKTISEVHGHLIKERDLQVEDLEASDIWRKLKPQDRVEILGANGLGKVFDVDIGTDQALIGCLESTPLQDWDDRVLALKTRINRAREQAVRLLEPKAVRVEPTPVTLNSREEVEDYIQKLREQLLAQVDEHPVMFP